jgi:hypothetical protein
LWVAIAEKLKGEECSIDGECGAEDRLDVLDLNGNGVVTVNDIQIALGNLFGQKDDDNEMALAKFVHSFVDSTGDGHITKKDFEVFCNEMNEENDMLPVNIFQLDIDPEQAEALLLEAIRAERDEPDVVAPGATRTRNGRSRTVESSAKYDPSQNKTHLLSRDQDPHRTRN